MRRVGNAAPALVAAVRGGFPCVGSAALDHDLSLVDGRPAAKSPGPGVSCRQNDVSEIASLGSASHRPTVRVDTG